MSFNIGFNFSDFKYWFPEIMTFISVLNLNFYFEIFDLIS